MSDLLSDSNEPVVRYPNDLADVDYREYDRIGKAQSLKEAEALCEGAGEFIVAPPILMYGRRTYSVYRKRDV